MTFRRYIFVLIVLLASAGMAWALWAALAPGGWTGAKAAMLLSGLAAAPWTGFCAANGLIGFLLVLRCKAVPPRVRPSGPTPHTAIAVTVRNEDMALVLPPVRRLLDELEAEGMGEAFAVFVLSDTADPVLTEAEQRAVAAFRMDDSHPGRPRPDRVHYRRRQDNTRYKAGNIMDFLEHHAEGFELMLVLDADSAMTAQAVLRLMEAMRDEPDLGIVQHLTVGLPASSAFPRLFQFGMRAGMRTWAAALSWWQDDSCVYWGHNALVRIAPFRKHCRLPLLPDGRPILSHDQVEAAILRGAGWKIRLLPEEDGSHEANPPALPEFMRRELRWMAGNFEYRHLLRLPGLRPMGRWQLIQAILLFGCSPFYLFFLLAAAGAALEDNSASFPFGPSLRLTLLWAGFLYAPKLLGYAEVLLSPATRARYGGAARVLAGIALETAFILTLDAINTLAKSLATARVALGLPETWTPQNRGDRGVSWSEAAWLLWPQTLLGVLVFACFAHAGRAAVVWAVPFAGGMLVAIPFCVVTSRPAVGRWLRERKLAAVPEEW